MNSDRPQRAAMAVDVSLRNGVSFLIVVSWYGFNDERE